MKFKNERTRQIWLRMKEAKKKEKKNNSQNENYTLPNIISAVASKSPNLNIHTIWSITLYQLYDQFNRLQINDVYEINKTSISVWGDSEKTFDSTTWYKKME